jgi:lipopolysaccharide/colanic/teichoic acid biosynthesis glycosyltransferase
MTSLEIPKNLLKKHNWIIKRIMDYAVTVPLFVISLPILGFLALWIKISSPGPAFFRQERIGLANRKIHIWKLRTMYVDAEQRLVNYLRDTPWAREEWDRFCKLREDPRILPGVGRFLRRTSLDELPQLWNILKGDMSLVGPRPFPEYHTEKFPRDFRVLRQRVWPGLTGLWQISERSEGDIEIQQALDTYYVQNWSPWLDIYIVSRTLGAVLAGKGAY